MLRLSDPSLLQGFSRRQRIDALKRSVPRRLVQRTIHQCRPHSRPCPVVPDELTVWLIIGIGLFFGDALRQVYRNLVPASARHKVPPRSTLCQARQRLGCRVMVQLARQVLRPLADAQTPEACYKGMPLRGIDTCLLSLADSPGNRAVFDPPRTSSSGRPAPAPAYPQAKLCCVCELGTHAMLQWLLKPARWADCNMAPPLLKRLEPNTLLLWDAAFYSPQNLRQVIGAGAHLLGRLSWSHKPRMIRRLDDGSYLAQLREGRSGWGPTVRIIEYELKGMPASKHKKHRLVTTLLDEKAHPALELAELYHRRWELELAIDELETHQMRQRVLASRTPAGVVQEVAGLLIAHWLVRRLMLEASVAAGVAPTRISFTGTLKLLRCRLGEAGASASSHRRWWKRLVKEVAEQEVIEQRRPRSNPRVLKRTTFDFPKKRKRHSQPRAPVPAFSQAFAILR